MIRVHKGDLPNIDSYSQRDIAIDTETLGLNLQRDRLCVVQLSYGGGDADIVQIPEGAKAEDAPNLCSLLQDPKRTKIFHFARFDIAVLQRHFGGFSGPVFCTKIASKLTRTYTDRHGLKELCSELLGVHLAKHQQCSDWGAEELTQAQVEYAASDVLYLHALRDILIKRLERERRTALAAACFSFLPARSLLDLAGWAGQDIFAHA